MKLTRLKTTACAILASAITASTGSAAEIKDVMKTAMKGETSLYKTVATHKGTQADADKLLACLKNLKGKKPPKGDQAAFDEKVTKLIAAAEDVAAKKPGALEKLQTAGNCNACHRAHRES
jgi:cytochrome c556